MNCQRCGGAGKVIEKHVLNEQVMPGNGLVITQSFSRMAPCPDCNGSGVGHCCDGLQCQPDDAD